jgi:hypothetical protein
MDITIDQLKEHIKNGQKNFIGITVEEGELHNFNLKDTTFEQCVLAVDFSNSEMIGNMLCSTDFKEAMLGGIIFKDNYYHSKKLELIELERMI